MKPSLKLKDMKLKLALVTITIVIAVLFRVFNEVYAFNTVNVEFRNVISDEEVVKLEVAIINETPYTYRNLILEFKMTCNDIGYYDESEIVMLKNLPFYSTGKVSVKFPKPPCISVNVKYSVEAKLAYGLIEQVKAETTTINIGLTRKETMFIVDPLPNKARRNSVVYITGRLVVKNSGTPVPHAKILVYDYDDGVWDNLLAYGYTDSLGYFRIPWVAKNVDFADTDAEIYLVFEGNMEYLPSRWPEKGYHKILVYEPLYPPP